MESEEKDNDLSKYVAGFLFDEKDQNKVVLIRKLKPAWQKGKLNGVGGKIEKGELPLQAMIREFKEEAGLEINDWQHTVRLYGGYIDNKPWVVYFYKAFGDLTKTQSQTQEALVVCDIRKLPEEVLYNIPWLIHLSRDNTLSMPIQIHEHMV